jgi:hypothetical protein
VLEINLLAYIVRNKNLVPLLRLLNLQLQQGCQMVCSQTKNPNLGKFWNAFDWKMFVYLMATWDIFWIFGIFYDH